MRDRGFRMKIGRRPIRQLLRMAAKRCPASRLRCPGEWGRIKPCPQCARRDLMVVGDYKDCYLEEHDFQKFERARANPSGKYDGSKRVRR
jgi:hypothetical protein